MELGAVRCVRCVAGCSSRWLLCRAAVVPFSWQPWVACRALCNTFRDRFCCCLCFLPWDVLFLDVGWKLQYVLDMSVHFKNPLHPGSVSRVFLLISMKVAIHQFLIGTGLINEQLRGAVLQLQLPDTNIASLCQGIQLSCISDQYLLLWLLLLL